MNNTASPCNISMPRAVETFQMVISIPVLILGLLFNTAALFLLCCKLREWTETKIYMTNLAVADFILLFSLPFKMATYHHIFAKQFCMLLVSVYYVNMYVSILTITAISVDRYIAIKHPFRARTLRSPLKAAAVCLMIWLIIGSFSVMVYTDSTHKDSKLQHKCFQSNAPTGFSFKLVLLIEMVGFCMPLVILTFCSTQAIYSLSKDISSDCRDEKRRGIHVIATNLVVFFICFAPIHVAMFLQHLFKTIDPSNCSLQQQMANFMHVSSCITNTNCCLDAVCYYFVAKEIFLSSSVRTSPQRDN
ncbi:G-protein coupled receptor 35-like [Acipenser oxyrinchus oxyrinchus]|uniref:G-protein coupled receptor 35-like n=1 Tax=Acipenser oxyrinchus oxyrinchus TaxID=40147 RepID=A0AAD8D4N5_ACIOX|nr:G-protein coupled receptor 35-like [Acipenser oxyrinchus oxyrinchus]